MSNMSYCRFRNTSGDLRDCAEHIHDLIAEDDEKRARLALIRTCVLILEDVGYTITNSNDDPTIDEIEPDED